MIKYLIVYNIFVFLIYGLDKYKAMRSKYRISEKTLIFLALFLGCVGACAGMVVFNHKTSSISFKTRIIFCCLINIVVFSIYIFML